MSYLDESALKRFGGPIRVLGILNLESKGALKRFKAFGMIQDSRPRVLGTLNLKSWIQKIFKAPESVFGE